MATFDHLVVAAADLAAGAAWLEDRLGAPLAPGGRHAAMATHNRLLRLGERTYLELIAIDPEAPAPGRPRWFALDTPAMQERLAERPRLIHWVAASAALEEEVSRCGTPLGDILAMRRGDFRWRITVPADGHLPAGGLLPSLIQWDVAYHPAERLPESGCVLMKLEGFHARPAEIAAELAALGLARDLALYPAEGDAPELVAYLKTPRGLIELD